MLDVLMPGMRGFSRQPLPPRSGVAYLTVLLLVLLMSTVGLAFLFRVHSVRKVALTRDDTLQAQYLAESAANHALWRLLNDPAFRASSDPGKYYLHSFAGGRYGYKVRVDTPTTFATVATIGLFGGQVARQSYVLYVKSPPSWNTFQGGAGTDYSASIAVDGTGTNIYVAGWSSATWESPLRAFSGGNDAYVARLDGALNLVWITFLGGAGGETVGAVAVDGGGNVVVAGNSTATWGSPIRAYTSLTDTYVAKLNSSGTLIWNTFLGGKNGNDSGLALAADSAGNVYAGGASGATWGSPVRAYTGAGDGFVAKLNSSGTLIWNTFLGGAANNDDVYGLAVDGSGNVYATGNSSATWGSPVRAYTGGSDTLVAKLNSSGTLTWNTFLGGSGSDYGNSVAVDDSANVYVVGYGGTSWGTPVRAFSGGTDAYAAKLSVSGALTWNTFLGGSANDYGISVAVDSSANVYVAGYGGATWGSPKRPYTAGVDGMVAQLGGSGTLTWNTFLGGDGNDNGMEVRVDDDANVLVAGYSDKTWEKPVRAYTSGSDGFVAKLAGIIDLNAGLIGYWKFDETSGTTAADSSGGGRNATMNNMDPATDWVSGRTGGALDFDGVNDYAITASFTPPPVGTVAFWMRVPGPPASHRRIFGISDTWEVRHVTTGTADGIPYGLVFDLHVSGVNTEFATTSTFGTAGQWNHIAAVFNANDSTYKIYVNGALQKSGTRAMTAAGAGQLSIGTRTGSAQYWIGTLDDLRIYNRKLSAHEIQSLFQTP